MAKLMPTNSEFFLPLEKFAKRYFFLNKYYNLIFWFCGLSVFAFGLLCLIEKRALSSIFRDYGLIVFLGLCAIHCNALFTLYLSDRIRRLKTYIEEIINEEPDVIYYLYKKVIFLKSSIILGMVIVPALGYVTFLWLGLNLPRGTIVVAYFGVIFVFGLLGMTLGYIINIWRFFLKIGKLKINVEPTHPDYMGGLKPIGDLNSAILYFGALLGVIYTLGANYMPYKNQALKMYANLWVVGAIIIYIIALLLPTFRIHIILVDVKREYQQRMNGIKKKLLPIFEKYWDSRGSINFNSDIANHISVMKYLQEETNKMQIWPYQNIWKTIISLATIQGFASILTNLDRISNFLKKIF